MIPNYGFYPQQQQRLNYLEQQMSAGLRGRPVASIEEVKAIPIDFDGSTFYFPDASNERIYTKQIGLNGQAILRMYQLSDIPQPQPQQNVEFVSKDEFNKAIEDLKMQIKQGGIENDKQQQQPNQPIF